MMPTIEGHHYEGGQLVLETIDAREDTNLISTEDGLVRCGETLTEEQQEKLALRERQ
jgi:hypothetical protein